MATSISRSLTRATTRCASCWARVTVRFKRPSPIRPRERPSRSWLVISPVPAARPWPWCELAVTGIHGCVSVLLGKGDGSFDLAGGYAAGVIPSCIAVTDLNQDGTADLIIANQGTYPFNNGDLSVLLGKGDGTFQPAWPLE